MVKQKIKLKKDETGAGEFTLKQEKGMIRLLIHNKHIVAEKPITDFQKEGNGELVENPFEKFFENIVENLGGRRDVCSKCGAFMFDEPIFFIDEQQHCEGCYKGRTKEK